MGKAQPASRMDSENGAEKHPQDQVAGSETNLQHPWPRNTQSWEAALWAKEVLATLLMAQLKIPCTRQKAQPGPAGSTSLVMTGLLQNSLGHSTKLWSCLCRDNPEPLFPTALPGEGTSEPGVVLGTSTTSWKKSSHLFGASELLPDVLAWRKGAAELASWRKCVSPAHGQVAQRASQAALAPVGDAQEHEQHSAPSFLPCQAWVCTQPPHPEASLTVAATIHTAAGGSSCPGRRGGRAPVPGTRGGRQRGARRLPAPRRTGPAAAGGLR